MLKDWDFSEDFTLDESPEVQIIDMCSSKKGVFEKPQNSWEIFDDYSDLYTLNL